MTGPDYRQYYRIQYLRMLPPLALTWVLVLAVALWLARGSLDAGTVAGYAVAAALGAFVLFPALFFILVAPIVIGIRSGVWGLPPPAEHVRRYLQLYGGRQR
ncbi:MAG: hypothetical protein ACR2K2_11395 [Mycobacteriales bacterium]